MYAISRCLRILASTQQGIGGIAIAHTQQARGQILGRNWDKSLKSFPPCYSQSPLLTDFTPPEKKVVCNVNIVYGNLKSENSQDYAQKPQGNCTFMNSASAEALRGETEQQGYEVHW